MAAANDSPQDLKINTFIAHTVLPPDSEGFLGLYKCRSFKIVGASSKSAPEYFEESVSPFLPVKELFVESRKCARSRFQYGRCDFIYNGMHIEQDATPIGLDMHTGDAAAFIPTYGKIPWYMKTLPNLKDMTPLGLNLCLGLTEDGLPFPREVGRHRKEIPRLKEGYFYVGPVRNSTPENVHSALPIVQLVPFSLESTVDEMVESWTFYVRKRGIEVKDRPSFVLHRDKKVALGKDTKIRDVIDTRLPRRYFWIPTTQRKPLSIVLPWMKRASMIWLRVLNWLMRMLLRQRRRKGKGKGKGLSLIHI